MQTSPEQITFHDGRGAPAIGLGVWQVSDAQASEIVQQAIRTGYRSIDTAAIYDNEAGVGQGIAASGLDRSELFLATKLWNDSHGHDEARAAFQESLERLGQDYVDLYLIHWPMPSVDRYVQSWETLIQLRDEGGAKSIGVCNFQPAHLQRLLDETGVIPVVNQIELHPYFQQSELRAFHAEHGIVTEAWSPLGQGSTLEDPVLAGLAQKHDRSVAQIVLRWHLQLGNMVIPKTVTPARMEENLAVGDFVLDEDDMARIAALDRADGRIGPDSDRFSRTKI